MKPFQDVVRDCPNLAPAEVYIFDQVDDRDPAAPCDPGTALVLYLADVLKFDQFDYRYVTMVVRHYRRALHTLALDLEAEFARRRAELPRVLFGVWDGRIATLSGVDTGLDMRTGEKVDLGSLPPPIKVVTYNLTAIMTLRWAGSVPEATPNDDSDQTAGALAGG